MSCGTPTSCMSAESGQSRYLSLHSVSPPPTTNQTRDAESSAKDSTSRPRGRKPLTRVPQNTRSMRPAPQSRASSDTTSRTITLPHFYALPPPTRSAQATAPGVRSDTPPDVMSKHASGTPLQNRRPTYLYADHSASQRPPPQSSAPRAPPPRLSQPQPTSVAQHVFQWARSMASTASSAEVINLRAECEGLRREKEHLRRQCLAALHERDSAIATLRIMSRGREEHRGYKRKLAESEEQACRPAVVRAILPKDSGSRRKQAPPLPRTAPKRPAASSRRSPSMTPPPIRSSLPTPPMSTASAASSSSDPPSPPTSLSSLSSLPLKGFEYLDDEHESLDLAYPSPSHFPPELNHASRWRPSPQSWPPRHPIEITEQTLGHGEDAEVKSCLFSTPLPHAFSPKKRRTTPTPITPQSTPDQLHTSAADANLSDGLGECDMELESDAEAVNVKTEPESPSVSLFLRDGPGIKPASTLPKSADPVSPCRDASVPLPKLELEHIVAMYQSANERIYCRACLTERRTSPQAKHPSVQWYSAKDLILDELVHHCAFDHPVAYARTAGLSLEQVYELRRRLLDGKHCS